MNYELQNKIPLVRFPKFKDEWEHRKLSDIFAEIKEAIGSRDIETYSITAGVGFISQKKKFGKNISGKQNSKYILIKPNQFSYNKGFSKSYNYGCVYLNQENKNIAVPNVFISFELIDKEMSSIFFAKLFESHYLDKGLRRIISSTARMDGLLNVNIKYFFELTIPVTSIPEQTHIAHFFTVLDNKINQLKEKKALLEDYKKGMMQKIFSQEIRFKPALSEVEGDDDGNDYPEWEIKKLGETATFSKGKGVSKNDISINGKTDCIRYGELYTHYNEIIFDIISKTNIDIKYLVLSKKNDVIIPASGEDRFDIATASCILKSDIAIGGDLNIIRSANNGIFLSYYLNSIKKMEIANLAQGVSVVHLYSSQLSALKVDIPSIPEQTKIANFLSKIDDKIKTVNEQIEETKEYKKGLLQRMYVV